MVATAATITASGVHANAADTEIRIGINGGKPSTWPFLSSALAAQGLTQAGWLTFGAEVGENWLPGTTGEALDYPAQLGPVSGPNALSGDQSTTIGQLALDTMIKHQHVDGQPMAVAGLSEGTLVIDQELSSLANDPNAPPAADLTFYVFGDMERGLGHMYFSGQTVPFFGKTFGPLPQSQYDTVVVNEEWDGWANSPDRPWDVLADLNAAMGAVYTFDGSNDHSQTALDSMSDAVLVSQTTSSLGGTVTTYVVPREQLPITKPLLQIGVSQSIVDDIDNLLRPFIQAGYSSMTPYLGPHIDQGKLVWTTSTPAPLTPATPVKAEMASNSTSKSAAVTMTTAVSAPRTADADGQSTNSGSGKDHPKSVGRHRLGVARAAAADAGTAAKNHRDSGAALQLRSVGVHEHNESDRSTDAPGRHSRSSGAPVTGAVTVDRPKHARHAGSASADD